MVYTINEYVWTKSEIKDVLRRIGYSISEISNQARFHYKDRDMYILAIKETL